MKSNEGIKKTPVEATKIEIEKKSKPVIINKQGKTETKPVLKDVEDKEETAKQDIKTAKKELKHNQEDAVQEDGKFQLNQLMSHVLEEELQDITIQIWKTLPDISTSDAERFVTERLRYEASDELKKILGLNVTKRLLNVSNPLFVKIQFSCRPENGCLTKFLQTYNITSFKRINQESNTFAAKVNSFVDFDNICTSKDMRCGSAKLTVTPCYKFTKCPDNLSSVYAKRTQYEFGKLNENTEKISNENNFDVKDNGNDKSDEILDRKDDLVKIKREEKPTAVTKILKSRDNPKTIKNDKRIDKIISNICKIKEIEYENEMFEEIDEMDPDFDEEMDDDEILALISSGVVVDQCSGSDQEIV